MKRNFQKLNFHAFLHTHRNLAFDLATEKIDKSSVNYPYRRTGSSPSAATAAFLLLRVRSGPCLCTVSTQQKSTVLLSPGQAIPFATQAASKMSV